MGGAFSKAFEEGGIYSRFFLEGAQPLFFSLGHCVHLIGRNRQQGWPSFAQAVIRCNGGGALNSMIQGKPNGLIAKYKNLWVTTLVWLLHQWCPKDAFHMAWRTFHIRDIYLVRGIAALGEGAYKARAAVEACDGARRVYGKNILAEIIAGTIVATGGTILLAMGTNLVNPVFSVSTCACTSVYYSVGRRLRNPLGPGETDKDGEVRSCAAYGCYELLCYLKDLRMKKWSKIIGQLFLVVAYWFQFSHPNPPKAFNPNRWLWSLHGILFPAAGLKVTPIGSINGYAY